MKNRVPTILVVDNDEGVVQAITTRLTQLGYTCANANTGAQALREFAAGPIDLVITDLNMPMLNGVDLVDKLRSFSDVPVIIVTGFRREYAAQLQQLYNVVVLPKPFNSSSLLDLVETELTLRGLSLASVSPCQEG